MAEKSTLNIVVDIERTSSPCGEMMTAGLVVLEHSLTRTFYGEFRPSPNAIWSEGAIQSTGITPEIAAKFPPKEETTHRLLAWLSEINPNGYPITTISDNPAFDMSPLWEVCYHFGNKSTPFGHSGRRIGDLFSGLIWDWQRGNEEWKKRYIPEGMHTHNVLDDALGNAHALIAIRAEYNLNIPL